MRVGWWVTGILTRHMVIFGGTYPIHLVVFPKDDCYVNMVHESRIIILFLNVTQLFSILPVRSIGTG